MLNQTITKPNEDQPLIRDNSSDIYSFPKSKIKPNNSSKYFLHFVVTQYEPKYLVRSTIISTRKIHNIISNISLTNKQRIHSYLFIEKLLLKSNQTKTDNKNISDRWVELPKNYLVKLYGTKYKTWLTILKENNIIVTKLNKDKKETYVAKNISTEKTKVASKQYRINPEFTDKIINLEKLKVKIVNSRKEDNKKETRNIKSLIEDINKGKELKRIYRIINEKYISNKVYNINPTILCGPKINRNSLSAHIQSLKQAKTDEMIDKTIKNISELKIDFEALKESVDIYVNSLDEQIMVDDDIPVLDIRRPSQRVKVRFADFGYDGIFTLSDPDKYYYTSLYNETVTKERHMCFFKGEYYSVKDVFAFKAMLKNRIRTSYNISIAKLENRDFFASRNDTNKRLDSNITNLPGLLTNAIMKQNDLVQFDLSNSQFAILAHIGKGKLDREFVNRAQNGSLYDNLIFNLGCQDRKDAKTKMFELFFSKVTSFLETKDSLSTIMPMTVDYVEKYKQENGYKNFAIMLQKFEAELFIDTILHRIMKSNIFALTKHDSVICKRNDAENVERIIKEEFDKIGFDGILKRED